MPCVTIKFSSFPNEPASGSCCASSADGYIAVSVTNTSGQASIPFKVYLDMYEPNEGGWVQMGYRSGSSSETGTHVSFDPNISSTRTYRVRCHTYPYGGANTGVWFNTASFTHAG